MEVAIIVPFIVFTSIVLIVGIPFYFRHRNRRVIYEAIKTSVEKTGEADPKLIEAITADSVGPNSDLRRGVIFLCIAVALAGTTFLADDPDAQLGYGVALFPGLIGAAYIVFHFFFPREPTI